MSPYKVKILVFENGERCPILLYSDGRPVFMPALYISTMVRSANHAAKTLERHLRAIMHLYTWAQIENIDIEERFVQGSGLALNEIDAIVRTSRMKYVDLIQMLAAPEKGKNPAKIVSLEKARAARPAKQDEVAGASAGTRIRAIRDYLDWLMLTSYKRTSIRSGDFQRFDIARREMETAFTARLPKNRGRSQVGLREALPQEDLDHLLKVLNPDDDENPWTDKSLAFRNQILFLMLYTLGLRRGEVLGIKIEDINFQKQELFVQRRADDPADVRTDQPNAKTRDRNLPLEKSLSDMIYDYIIKHRSKIPNANRQPFLFVTHKAGNHQGRPLSVSGYSKVVETLRARAPGLPSNLSGHVLRHSWNETFSRIVDDKGLSEEREQQMRAYLMGWSPTSKTAATYTRRHIRKKGQEASLKLQRNILTEGGHDE